MSRTTSSNSGAGAGAGAGAGSAVPSGLDQLLYGQEEVHEAYDPSSDKECVLTCGRTYQVAGLNAHNDGVVAFSWIHPGKNPGCKDPCVRIYGVFDSDDAVANFLEATETIVPDLQVAVTPLFTPFLMVRDDDRLDDLAALNTKIQDLVEAHTERLSSEARATLADLEGDEDGAREYRRYQLHFVRSAGVFEMAAEELEAVEEERAKTGASVGSARNRHRQRRRANQAKRKARKARERAQKPRFRSGISSTNPEHRGLVSSQQNIAAVAILLDDDEEAAEHLVWFLGVFASIEDLTAWTRENHKHMRRFTIYDVPTWEWWSLKKRVLDTSVKQIFENKQHQTLHDAMMAEQHATTLLSDVGPGMAAADGMLTIEEEARGGDDTMDAEAAKWGAAFLEEEGST